MTAKKMLRAAAGLLCWLLIAGVSPAIAADTEAPTGGSAAAAEDASRTGDGPVGRYRAVHLDGSSMFVLDTRSGHMWVWAFGKEGGFLTYQGRLVPGQRMGDIVNAYPKKKKTP